MAWWVEERRRRELIALEREWRQGEREAEIFMKQAKAEEISTPLCYERTPRGGVSEMGGTRAVGRRRRSYRPPHWRSWRQRGVERARQRASRGRAPNGATTIRSLPGFAEELAGVERKRALRLGSPKRQPLKTSWGLSFVRRRDFLSADDTIRQVMSCMTVNMRSPGDEVLIHARTRRRSAIPERTSSTVPRRTRDSSSNHRRATPPVAPAWAHGNPA
jgi:hypothetical protein